MVAPFVEVSHLASSSSFYGSILQPLGLQFFETISDGDSLSPPSALTYGVNGREAILELRQSENPLKPPKLSSLVLTAPSRSAVAETHARGLKANPPLWSSLRNRPDFGRQPDDRDRAERAGPWLSTEDGVTACRAVVYDLDGNRLEVVCPDIHEYDHRAPQVLEWIYDIKSRSDRTGRASGNPGYSSSRRVTMSASEASHHSQGRRSSHTAASARSTTETAQPSADDFVSPRQSSKPGGLSTTTVVGAILGVAAGAALTYGLVSSRDSPREDRGDQPAPPLPRRATFPEKPVTSRRYPTWHEDQKSGVDDYATPRRIVYPEVKTMAIRGGAVDDDMDHRRESRSPPRYSTQAPISRGAIRSRPPSEVRAFEEVSERDTRGRQVPPSSGSRAPKIRPRSEAPRERTPLSLDHEHPRPRRDSTTRRSAAPESVVSHSRPPPSRTHRPAYEPERDSYVSARTHRSSSTVRAPKTSAVAYEAVPRSRAPSHVSVSTARELPRGPSIEAVSHYSARRVPLPRSGVGSSHAHWEPRDVPLPRSMVGSSHANWDPMDVPLPMSDVGSSHANWDDDLASVAPSDSISCAGSKGSRRSRKHRR